MRLSAGLLTISLLWIAPVEVLGATPEALRSGLGNFMSAIQMRHAKLWFAGKAMNWRLAAYELDELKEAFADVAKYQPEFKGKPIAELIGRETDVPVASLQKAIDARDLAKFTTAMDQLSGACTLSRSERLRVCHHSAPSLPAADEPAF